MKGTLLTLTISIGFPVLNGRKPMSHMSFIPKQRNINDVLSLEHLFIHLDVFFEKTHKIAARSGSFYLVDFLIRFFFKLIGFPKKPGSKMTNLKAFFFGILKFPFVDEIFGPGNFGQGRPEDIFGKKGQGTTVSNARKRRGAG